MSKKFFVVNKTGRDLAELKPGLGTFHIKKDSKLECSEEVAKAIIADFQAVGLELEVQELAKPVVKVHTPDPVSKVPISNGKRKEN